MIRLRFFLAEHILKTQIGDIRDKTFPGTGSARSDWVPRR
jgi:hypothetical protein